MMVGYCKTPEEVKVGEVDYKDIKVIQRLLRAYKDMEILVESGASTDFLILYMDFTDAIEKAQMTPRQAEVVGLYMDGHETEPIGRELGITHQGVRKLLMKACNKISEYMVRGQEQKRGKKN